MNAMRCLTEALQPTSRYCRCWSLERTRIAVSDVRVLDGLAAELIALCGIDSEGTMKTQLRVPARGFIAAVVVAACGSEAPAPAPSSAAPAPASANADPSASAEADPSAPAVAEPTTPNPPAGGYTLGVKPTVLHGGDVRLDVVTNIPGVIEVMAGLSLHGQAGNDVHIGKSERVRVANGSGSVIISASDLPQGRYDAEVSFYPRWGFQDPVSRASGISENIEVVEPITIVGSGESAVAAKIRNEGQKWVMENFTMGDPWTPNEWVNRFGNYSELPISRGNPRILKAYYFPRIDMTLIVNVLKGEIVVWRLGQANS
jgi:hypothetical protein